MSKFVGASVKVDGKAYYDAVMNAIYAKGLTRTRLIKIYPELGRTFDSRIVKKNSVNKATSRKLEQLFGVSANDYIRQDRLEHLDLPMYNADILAMQIVQNTYYDYIKARMKILSFEANEHPTSYSFEAKMEYLRMRKNAENVIRRQFNTSSEGEIQYHLRERMKVLQLEYESQAEDCREFFRSRWFSMMVTEVDGEEFLKLADEKVLLWASGKLQKTDILKGQKDDWYGD